MAIFGDLADMPTPEVLRMLGSRTGKLLVRPNLKKQFELHLLEGAIFCFKEDGFSVRDPEDLRRGVTSLLRLQHGGFEFNQVPVPSLEHHIDLSRQAVLELSAALDSHPVGAADTAEGSLDPKTRFKFKEVAGQDFEVPDNLRVFLRRAHAQLEAGCSAEELAATLTLHPSVVQLYLLRLRSLDKIAPVRAYAANYKGYSAAPAAATVAPVAPVASGFMTTMTTTMTTTTATTVAVAAALVSDPAAQPAPQKSLIRRLLSAFSFGGR